MRENLAVTCGRPPLGKLAREIVCGHGLEPEPAVQRRCDLLDLEQYGDLMPDKLSQGQRKLVGVAHALAARPRVICLDEPAAGLDTAESEQLGRRLREIVEQGTALLLVDHDMGLVLSVCDRVVVLDFGREIARGTTAEVRSNPKVVEAYLGSAATEVMGKDAPETQTSPPAMSEPLLRVDCVTAGYAGAPAIREVTLRVSPGEIVALLGANGAGKTTTLRVISGHGTSDKRFRSLWRDRRRPDSTADTRSPRYGACPGRSRHLLRADRRGALSLRLSRRTAQQRCRLRLLPAAARAAKPQGRTSLWR